MATKLYFHNALSTDPGTLPTSTQSGSTINASADAQTVNRTMTTTIGTSQTSKVVTTLGQSTAQNLYFTKFVSNRIQATSIAANTWTFQFAAQESNANANFPVTTSAALVKIVAYVWDCETGTKVGNILIGNGGTYSEAGTSETALTGTFTGSAVSGFTSSHCVIVIEIFFTVTQGNTTSRTDTFFYDGTTEASTTSNAAFLSTPETIPLATLQTKTHTTDSLIKKTQTNTHTTDSLVLKTQTKTQTTDSLKLKTQTVTHTTDSLILKNQSHVHTTDSLILKNQSKTHTTDAFLAKPTTVTKTHTTDSLILETQTKTHSTDSLILKNQSKTQTTDSLILKNQTHTHLTDSLILKNQTKTQTTDSLIQKNQTKTQTIDSLLQKTQTVIQTTDSLLQRNQNKTHTTDSFLATNAVTKTLTHGTDSLLQTTENYLGHTTDAYIVSGVTPITTTSIGTGGLSWGKFADRIYEVFKNKQKPDDYYKQPVKINYGVSDVLNTTKIERKPYKAKKIEVLPKTEIIEIPEEKQIELDVLFAKDKEIETDVIFYKERPNIIDIDVLIAKDSKEIEVDLNMMKDTKQSMITAKHVEDKLQKLAALTSVPSFEEAKKGYDRINKPELHKNGFTYIPQLDKAFGAPEGKHLQKLFGDGKHPLHFIAVTDIEGTKLDDRHKHAYNKLISEGKEPTIGGYTETNGKAYTDVAYHKPMSDEEARKHLKEHKQRSSGRYDLDGKFTIFS